MAVWEKATLSDTAPGSRFDIDGTGPDWVRVLSPSFRLNDGSTDYGFVGWGAQVIPIRSDLPTIPEGFAFLIDTDGAYLIDEDGALLIAEAA